MSGLMRSLFLSKNPCKRTIHVVNTITKTLIHHDGELGKIIKATTNSLTEFANLNIVLDTASIMLDDKSILNKRMLIMHMA